MERRVVSDRIFVLKVTHLKNRILLINLGGPRAASEIEKFLIDLFEDPLVFDLPLPEWIRKPLARLIAKKGRGR